jgi:hypothetical protein
MNLLFLLFYSITINNNEMGQLLFIYLFLKAIVIYYPKAAK